jgi:hypothetical protein
MFNAFRALAERVKALFVAYAGLELAAEFLVRGAARQAQLLRQAAENEKEGCATLQRSCGAATRPSLSQIQQIEQCGSVV